MSESRWCDPGKHCFPLGQPGSTTFTLDKQVKNQWGGWQPQKITQEACGACAIDLGLADIGKKESTSEEAEREAREIRHNATGGKFPLLSPAQHKAIESDGSVRDPEEAKRRGYDPSYVKWLEDQEEKAKELFDSPA